MPSEQHRKRQSIQWRRLVVSVAWVMLLAGCTRPAAPGHGLWSARGSGPSASNASGSPASRDYPHGMSHPDVTPADFIKAGEPRGEQLYATFCTGCHGADGRGLGRTSAFSRLPPADFTRAEFRWKSTPPDSLPTDGDLERLIRSGFGGDGAMPAFPFLAADDLSALLQKVKSFSPRWRHERPAAPLPAPRPEAAQVPTGQTPARNHVPADTATVSSYWRSPLHAGTESVASSTCASCHPLQFADWSRSRHALAMGPGVWAQMQERNSGGECVRCHAPLTEQANDQFLLADGISCAACHVRAGRTFGPAPTPTTLLPLVSGVRPAHGKMQTRTYFEQPEFCSGCHHFPAGTAPMVAGTTLQNTYEEWRNSRAAREGKTCQTCHMPDRRHFFRGIHDPDTVRRAVRWTFDVSPRAKDVQAHMTLTNVGAGHFLPTYVVPEIWMRIDVRDDAGVTLGFAEHRIARKVTFENGDWTQTSDTRLAPDETVTLDYSGPLPPAAALIVGRVIVLPDLWQADKFRARIPEAQSDTARRYYSAALAETETSGYTLFKAERRLTR